MKTSRWLILLSVFYLTTLSCHSRQEENRKQDISADSVIPEKKFISLMTDLHLLEAGLMIERNRGQQDRKWALDAYTSLFRRYRVTRTQLLGNLEYYQKDPANFEKIYDTIIKRLNSIREKETTPKKSY